MKVNYVSNVKFQSAPEIVKRRFLTPNMQNDVQQLLWKMNHSTRYKENASHTRWESDILAGLSIGKRIRISDNRHYEMPIDNPSEMNGDCEIKVGNIFLKVNSTTGEINSYEKGIFTTWHSVYQQVAECLREFLANFDNPQKVTQTRFSIAGYTKKKF